MDEYEPITGELRKAFMANGGIATLDGCIIKEYMTIAKSELDDLCDNIDSVHAQLERDYKTACEVNERQNADYVRLKAERDSMAAALDAAQGEHAYAPESHYMMLPKDVDGKPVHVGDVMEWDDGQTAEVVGVSSDTFFYVDYANDSADWAPARDKRHHHAPTVEDVLRGVVTLCHNTWKEGSAFEFYDVDDVMESGNIAEYAAKLCLAGEK